MRRCIQRFGDFLSLRGAGNYLLVACALLLSAQSLYAEPTDSTQHRSEYRIDEPGTITFTVGVTIRGKVEKPQVVIFLPKERPYYRDLPLARSFRHELTTGQPLQPRDLP